MPAPQKANRLPGIALLALALLIAAGVTLYLFTSGEDSPPGSAADDSSTPPPGIRNAPTAV
ncbi:hypothetical protein EDM76_13895, partial [bacterium]